MGLGDVFFRLRPTLHTRSTNQSRFVLNSGVHVSFDPDAPSKGQIDVLLQPISILRHHQDLLSGRQIQSQQHSATRQVVLQLPVSRFILLVCFFLGGEICTSFSASLSFRRSTCLSVRHSAFLSFHLSIRVSFCLSAHPNIN